MTPDEMRAKQEKAHKNKLYQLIGMANQRGYNNPEAWAAKMMTQEAAKRRRA